MNIRGSFIVDRRAAYKRRVAWFDEFVRAINAHEFNRRFLNGLAVVAEMHAIERRKYQAEQDAKPAAPKFGTILTLKRKAA